MSNSACLQEVPEAVEDLKAAAKLAPQDKGIRAALSQAKEHQKASVESQRAAYRRMMAPSKPVPGEAAAGAPAALTQQRCLVSCHSTALHGSRLCFCAARLLRAWQVLVHLAAPQREAMGCAAMPLLAQPRPWAIGLQ